MCGAFVCVDLCVFVCGGERHVTHPRHRVVSADAKHRLFVATCLARLVFAKRLTPGSCTTHTQSNKRSHFWEIRCGRAMIEAPPLPVEEEYLPEGQEVYSPTAYGQ